MSQCCSIAVSTNCSAVTSTPRSTTSSPLPSIMILTRFLPMSCISPRTVPRQTRPIVSLLSPVMYGLSSSVAAAMQRAAMSISGTKARLAEKSSPRMVMPRTRPSVRISCAPCPLSSASEHSCSTRFCCPRTSADAMRESTSPCGCPASGALCARQTVGDRGDVVPAGAVALEHIAGIGEDVLGRRVLAVDGRAEAAHEREPPV